MPRYRILVAEMMKRNEISATGTIDRNGRLAMYMEEINAFFRDNKGQRVIATFHVAPTATSEAMKAYYFKYIVPTITRAAYENGDRRTQQDTDKWLREMAPVCWDESVNIETGEYNERLRDINELSNSEFIEYIDFLKQFAAEEYNVYVEEPQNL